MLHVGESSVVRIRFVAQRSTDQAVKGVTPVAFLLSAGVGERLADQFAQSAPQFGDRKYFFGVGMVDRFGLYDPRKFLGESRTQQLCVDG